MFGLDKVPMHGGEERPTWVFWCCFTLVVIGVVVAFLVLGGWGACFDAMAA